MRRQKNIVDKQLVFLRVQVQKCGTRKKMALVIIVVAVKVRICTSRNGEILKF